MTQAPGQQTISPQRQMAASQVGAVFNSLHEYLRTLEPHDENGNQQLTKQLEFAHCRVDEAAMWAIKSVLTYGLPPAPPSGAAQPPAAPPTVPADSAANEEAAPVNTGENAQPAPVVVPLEDNAVVPDARYEGQTNDESPEAAMLPETPAAE